MTCRLDGSGLTACDTLILAVEAVQWVLEALDLWPAHLEVGKAVGSFICSKKGHDAR